MKFARGYKNRTVLPFEMVVDGRKLTLTDRIQTSTLVAEFLFTSQQHKCSECNTELGYKDFSCTVWRKR